jgi:nucleoside-diphosphate-sugar epimerase
LKYFVTGGTGFIGGHVIRQLAANGHRVTALVRSRGRATALSQLGVTLAEGDVTEKASMRAPMTGADGVFHLAAWYKVGAREKAEAERVNVDGTRHVLELMRETEVLDLAEKLTGVKAPRLRPAPAVLKAASRAMAVIERVAPVPGSYSSESLRVIAGVTYLGSSAKAQRELGFAPRPLEEGLKETLEYEMRLQESLG